MKAPPAQSSPTTGEEEELSPRERGLRRLLLDIALFSRYVIGTPLRPYQLEPALAILDSVLHRHGRTFTVMMSRQAGKNELSAQLEAYLLNLFQRSGGSIVKAAPTFHPQIATSLHRLERALENDLNRGRWTRHLGSIQVGRARVLFFSGEPEAHVVGATASLLLEIDEAQDFDEDKYLKDFRPMGASTNVTTVLYGTAWTGDTLLEHVRRDNQRLEAQDGIRRNFAYPWAAVAEHNPSYRSFVEAEIARMGAEHPLVRTQYLLEPISGGGRFLSETQLAQMAGRAGPAAEGDPGLVDTSTSGPWKSGRPVHEGERLPGPEPGADWRVQGPPLPAGAVRYVAGIDLAGEDEEAEDAALRAIQPQRDSTAVAIGQIEWAEQLGVAEPTVRIVHLYWWTGRKHRELLPQLIDLLRNVWRTQSVVVDATGVGAGVASFLVGALGADVAHPFTFTAVSKSDLGYQLLTAINSGRLRAPRAGPAAKGDSDPPDTPTTRPWVSAEDDAAPVEEFWRQARLARSTLHANQRLSFYVDPREGHDDLLIAVALAVEAAQHSRPRVATGRVARR